MDSAPQSNRGCRSPDPLQQILCSVFILVARSCTVKATICTQRGAGAKDLYECKWNYRDAEPGTIERPLEISIGKSFRHLIRVKMGNVESAEHYCPYICLLRHLLKVGGVSISEGQLLELLQAVDKCCCWFPSIGRLDSQVWEKKKIKSEKSLKPS